ncbi:MAG: FliH/SctL family protein [Actinomycetota bacterium]|nr:FliH/SctL family protein [Actinomycetota bacterium]
MAAAPAIAFVPPALPPSSLARQQRELEVRSGVAQVYDEARRDGMESARAEVAATVAEYERRCVRLDAILSSLDAARTDLAARDAVTLRDVEVQTRTLAVALAEAIVGHEVAVAVDPVGDSVRRSAALLPDRGPVIVRVHPLDLEAARTAAPDWFGEVRSVEIVADAAIDRGACALAVGPLRIDAQISTAFERMRALLLP